MSILNIDFMTVCFCCIFCRIFCLYICLYIFLSLLVRHKAFYNGTPLTFMEMDISCRTQDTKQKKSPSWCVMLTLNRKGCKLNFYFGANFFIWTTENEQNWLYAKDQKQKKNGNNAQFHYPSIQNIFLLPLWEPVLPLCAILRAKSR